jgi:hypothetical protein
MKDFYYILGTHSNSTPGEIGEAYRKLSQKLAPAAEEDYFLQSHLNEISEAYEILSNPTKRSLYDAAYKRNHRKQLANFKTRHINIALTIALIIFTALFGIYVFRLISSNKSTQIIATSAIAEANPAPLYKVKHHRRKAHPKAIAAAINKPVPAKKDTVKAAIAKPAPIVQSASVTQITPSAAVVSHPVVVTHVSQPVDSSYTTYLKPNLTGSVYLHQLADYMSSVVTVLPSHSKIKVLEKGRTFYKIAFNNQVGYIPKTTITTP